MTRRLIGLAAILILILILILIPRPAIAADTCMATVPCKIVWDVPQATAEGQTQWRLYKDTAVPYSAFTLTAPAGIITFTVTFTTTDVGTRQVTATALSPAGESLKSAPLTLTVTAAPLPTAPINGRVGP